jgi:hypothetical protein
MPPTVRVYLGLKSSLRHEPQVHDVRPRLRVLVRRGSGEFDAEFFADGPTVLPADVGVVRLGRSSGPYMTTMWVATRALASMEERGEQALADSGPRVGWASIVGVAILDSD